MDIRRRNRWVRWGRTLLLLVLLGTFIRVLYHSEQDSPRFRWFVAFILVFLLVSTVVFHVRNRELQQVERDLASQGVNISPEAPEPFFTPARRRSDNVAGIIALLLIAAVFVAYWLGFLP